MITIHYDFTDGTEVSYAEGKKLGDDFTTNCLDFFTTDNDAIIVKRDGSFVSISGLLKRPADFGTNKQIRYEHNLQKMLKAGSFAFKSNRVIYRKNPPTVY